jgi:hypothetical protein
MNETEYHTQSTKADSDLHNSSTVVAVNWPVTRFYPDLLDTATKVKTPHIHVHKHGDSIILELISLLYTSIQDS